MGSDCPLCLEPLSPEDICYEIKCPTRNCEFNFCSNCIEGLSRSAADGYQEASDGSNQVKVQMKCPQCREKYQSKTYPSDIIVSSVLLLRKASSIQKLILDQVDSELSASELGVKHSFLKTTSMEELQDAVSRLQFYNEEIGKNGERTVPPLDWEKWRAHVRELATNSSSPKAAQQEKPWSDPTLFCGLDELITSDEQEFVTSLLTSGKVESLASAAHILNGILDMAATRAVQQLSTFAVAPPRLDAQALQKIRKKYPLPAHMPRCVRLPVYDPSSDAVLRFDKKKPDSLALIGVRGTAGRLGLRKGDIVTHVNGEDVSSIEEYQRAFERCQGEETIFLIVNANAETAKSLRKRAETMRNDKFNF